MPEASRRTHEMQVRGIALIALREYVNSRLQGEANQRFFSRLPTEVKDIIFEVNGREWYPFSIDTLLREEITREFNPQDPRVAIFDAGLYAANYDISSFIRTLMGFIPVRSILNRAQTLWDKFYRPGKFYAQPLDNGAIFELTEFPSDPLFCPMIDAWLTVAARRLRLQGSKVSETACIHEGDELCRWEVHWS